MSGQPLFYLGTHQIWWMWYERFREVPLFISRRRLVKCRQLRTAVGPWALDSGGFTELQQFGKWTISPERYVEEVRRYKYAIGKLQWAAIQDWMCEPMVIAGGKFKNVSFAGTGLCVREHQRRTVESLLTLRGLAPEMPWVPVLQGWEIDDYLRHFGEYLAAGIDLRKEPLVGVGSVCRRENTDEAERLIRELSSLGLRLHGFGFKTGGLQRCLNLLASADSMAWSFDARFGQPLPDCRHDTCSSCPRYALTWRDRLLDRLNNLQVP